MITIKELGYVNSWPNRVPYPGIDYCEETLEKLNDCLNLFEQEYANKKYNISFSNKEEIEFEILQKNLCHMLGINYKNLSGNYFNNYRNDVLGINPNTTISSYNMLTSILENSDNVLAYDKEPANCNSRALNYYKIAIKCDIFRKLADLGSFNYGCINFDKNLFLENNPDQTFGSNSTKFLYTPSDEIISPYFMMGLKNDNLLVRSEVEENDVIRNYDTPSNNYIVETLIAPESLKKFFEYQEVTIPTQILVDINGVLNKKIATPQEKIRLLKEYQAIINEYEISNRINIYGDYLSLLMSSSAATLKK